jgi:hypothetical protein
LVVVRWPRVSGFGGHGFRGPWGVGCSGFVVGCRFGFWGWRWQCLWWIVDLWMSCSGFIDGFVLCLCGFGDGGGGGGGGSFGFGL